MKIDIQNKRQIRIVGIVGTSNRKDNVQSADVATSVHYNVGKEVRSAIEKIGGTMPEYIFQGIGV